MDVSHFEWPIPFGNHPSSVAVGSAAFTSLLVDDGLQVTRTSTVGQQTTGPANKSYCESWNGSGRHCPAFSLIASIRVQHKIWTQGEPAPLPRFATGLETEKTTQYGRSLHIHLENWQFRCLQFGSFRQRSNDSSYFQETRPESWRWRRHLGSDGGWDICRFFPSIRNQNFVAWVADSPRFRTIVSQCQFVIGAPITSNLWVTTW